MPDIPSNWLSYDLNIATLAILLIVALAFGRRTGRNEEWKALQKRPERTPRPLPWWAIGLAVVLVITSAVGAYVLIRDQVAEAPGDEQLTIEIVRTALTVAVGVGGVWALFITSRRQRLSEQDHALQSKVAQDNRHDATERRVTELYGRAVDQLASESPASRLAALYALERLANTNLEHRQTIVDLICAYLRIRRDLLDAEQRGGQARQPEDLGDPLWIPGRDESEVRATAQRILKAHLTTEADHLWRDMRLDLHGAKLEDFSLGNCQVGDVDFRNAEFWGKADFAGASFAGEGTSRRQLSGTKPSSKPRAFPRRDLHGLETDDLEEDLQVERDREQRVRADPRLYEPQIVIQHRMPQRRSGIPRADQARHPTRHGLS